MDTSTFLLIVLLVVLIAIYWSRRGAGAPGNSGSSGEPSPGSSAFVFVPLEADLLRRQVTIVAPDQLVDGKARKLLVDVLPLPPDPPLPPPEGKDIDLFITTVIHPRVRYADSLETVDKFDPPLTITVNYSKEDAEKGGYIDGTPNLSILTFYQDGEVWRWEKLKTDVHVEDMTLTAKLQTLHPADPVGLGH